MRVLCGHGLGGGLVRGEFGVNPFSVREVVGESRVYATEVEVRELGEDLLGAHSHLIPGGNRMNRHASPRETGTPRMDRGVDGDKRADVDCRARAHTDIVPRTTDVPLAFAAYGHSAGAERGRHAVAWPMRREGMTPSKRYPIDNPYEAIAEFCRRNHIRKLSLFGSVLRDDFTPESDVDVLVEFEPGATPGWEIVSMQGELEAILGRAVDFRTVSELSRYFRDEVLSEAETIYVAA